MKKNTAPAEEVLPGVQRLEISDTLDEMNALLEYRQLLGTQGAQLRCLREKVQQFPRKNEHLPKEKGQYLREKDQLIREKDQLIMEKDQLIREKDQLIREKDQLIIEKEQQSQFESQAVGAPVKAIEVDPTPRNNVAIDEDSIYFEGYVRGDDVDAAKAFSWIYYINTRFDSLQRDIGNAYDIVFALSRGDARNFLFLTYSSNKSVTWEEIKMGYINVYGLAHYGRTIQKELSVLNQGNKSIAHYNKMVRDILTRYKIYSEVMNSTRCDPSSNFEWYENDIKLEYIAGLRKEYRDDVFPLRREMSMEELYHYTMMIRQGLDARKEKLQAVSRLNNRKKNRENNKNPPVGFPAPHTHGEIVPTVVDNLTVNQKGRTIWPPEVYALLKAKKGCFSCGQYDHMSFNCDAK